MASTATVSKSEHDELCCGYAALILQDEGSDVTSDSITKLITASGNEVESYWAGLFAKAVGALDLKELLSSVGSGAAAGPAAAGGDAAAAVVEEPEEPQEEEADVDMGDIFGGGDDDY